MCISFFIFDENLLLNSFEFAFVVFKPKTRKTKPNRNSMGVTIHYRGKLKSPDLINPLMDEVEEICISNNWKYQLLNEEISEEGNTPPIYPLPFENDFEDDGFNHGLRGISFEPHEESESVTFLFNAEGILTSIFSNMFRQKSKYTWCFVKTQFAGADTHIRIINLMRYLKKKYFKKFEIHDDGGYYPHGNAEELQNRFDYLNNAISTVHDIFENIQIDDSKSPDEFIDEIRNALSASLKGVSIQIVKIDPLSMMTEMLKKLEKEAESEVQPKKKRKKKKDTDEDFDLPF